MLNEKYPSSYWLLLDYKKIFLQSTFYIFILNSILENLRSIMSSGPFFSNMKASNLAGFLLIKVGEFYWFVFLIICYLIWYSWYFIAFEAAKVMHWQTESIYCGLVLWQNVVTICFSTNKQRSSIRWSIWQEKKNKFINRLWRYFEKI